MVWPRTSPCNLPRISIFCCTFPPSPFLIGTSEGVYPDNCPEGFYDKPWRVYYRKKKQVNLEGKEEDVSNDVEAADSI